MIDYSSMNYITERCYELLGSGKTQKNDILYCLRGSLGKTAIVRDSGSAAIASSLVIIRPSNESDSNYLYHFLTSPLGSLAVRKFDNGSSQPNLSANSVKGYLLPLPPLPEQRRIASVAINELGNTSQCNSSPSSNHFSIPFSSFIPLIISVSNCSKLARMSLGGT